jgi:hypothetical protein
MGGCLLVSLRAKPASARCARRATRAGPSPANRPRAAGRQSPPAPADRRRRRQEKALEHSAERKCGDAADGKADADVGEAAPEHAAQQSRRWCAERGAHAELAAARGDGDCCHRIQADAGEQDRERSEQADQRGVHALRGRRVGDVAFEQTQAGDTLARIDLAQHRAQALGIGGRCVIDADRGIERHELAHQVEQAIRHLRERHVDDRRCVFLRAELAHVADDPDDAHQRHRQFVAVVDLDRLADRLAVQISPRERGIDDRHAFRAAAV